MRPPEPHPTVEWRFMMILPSGFAADYPVDGFNAALERGRRCWLCDWYIERRHPNDDGWKPWTPKLRNVIVEARDDAPLIVRARDDAVLRVFDPNAGAHDGRGSH
jgi:hypothetical protein